MTSFDHAILALYQAPLSSFVAERKRLSAELQSAGDTAGAARLAKLGRPPLSAWAVNQLWWQARSAFDELFAAAERVRRGDLDATSAHRDALAKLRARAATLLREADHAATEATLRRVTTTLTALAASGSFDPDPPGALSADRDAPGFESAALLELAAEPQPDSARNERELAEARKQQKAERRRLELLLRDARDEIESSTRELDRLRHALPDAEARVERARTALRDLELRLAELERAD